MTTDLLTRASEALDAAERSRHPVPETVPRLPHWRPAPILPRHIGRYDDPYADERGTT